MKNLEKRHEKILKRANELSGEKFNNWEDAEDWLYNSGIIDERHEAEVKSLGRHGQRVDFGDWWTQGEIVDFSKHWFDAPETEVDHSKFINEEGKVIQLYYVVGHTHFNAPEGYYYSEKTGEHEPEPTE